MIKIEENKATAYNKKAIKALLLFICYLGSYGCTNLYKLPELPGPSDAPAYYKPAKLSEYKIQLEDHLLIQSYYDSQLNQNLVVRPDGRISPVLIGDINVVGKTTSILAVELKQAYSKFLDSPDITVSVSKVAPSKVYVGGEVLKSSVHVIHENLTLMQAITMAGGFKETANLKQVLLLRRKDEKQSVNQINVDDVLNNKVPDIYLAKNDIVFVPRSAVATGNLRVQQYITRMIPEFIRISLGYQKLETDSTSTSVQAVVE